jgi:hypothetical protein
MILAIFPLLLIAAAVVGMVRADHLLWYLGPLGSFPHGSGIFSVPAGVGLVYIPFWTVMFLAIGLVLLVALSAAGGLRDVAAWSALFLFVLWLLQIGKVAGVYRGEQDLPPGSSWATQYAAISARWWALAVLVLAAIAVAIGSRLRRPRTEPEDPSGGNTEGGEGLEGDRD